MNFLSHQIQTKCISALNIINPGKNPQKNYENPNEQDIRCTNLRILLLHSNYIEYQAIKKEIDIAEESDTDLKRYEDIVVLFTCLESQDDENTIINSLSEIKSSLNNLNCSRIVVYPYSHLSDNLAKASKAISLLNQFKDGLSDEGNDVQSSPFGWNKSFTISVKGHPLAEQLKIITSDSNETYQNDALKSEERLESKYIIMSVDGNTESVEKFNFNNYKNLKALQKSELSKSRVVTSHPPHVELMKKLSLVDYEPGSDSGNLRFYPKGRFIKSLLERYVTSQVKKYGALEVETPIMYDSNHPSLASYLNRFPARQYTVNSDNKELFLRFSACFGQFLMLHDCIISHKQLPVKLYELTRYSFRREKSGELVGLRRLRAFTMPDCHALCKDIEASKTEILKRFTLSRNVLQGIGFNQDDYELAIRVTQDFYDDNVDFIKQIVKDWNRPIFIEIWPEKFFYFIFKWEFNFIDTLGKASALATDQIDVENAERYGITYVDDNGDKKTPIILHNSPSGAIERCLYALLEKAAKAQREGKTPSIPFWLCPTQIRIIPLSQDFHEVSLGYLEELSNSGLRVDFEDRDLSVGKKVREAEKEWIPFILVVGKNEVESKKFQVRDRYSGEMIVMSLSELTEHCKQLLNDMITEELPLSKFISDRFQFK